MESQADEILFHQNHRLIDVLRYYKGIDKTTLAKQLKISMPTLYKILEDLWSEYAKYKVVITDRYHGTIFSLIAATPVLVIPSSDHKLSSGVDWFPESYKEYVKYLSDISSIPDEVARIYQTDYQYRLPSYFKENYYDKLKSIIESD